MFPKHVCTNHKKCYFPERNLLKKLSSMQATWECCVDLKRELCCFASTALWDCLLETGYSSTRLLGVIHMIIYLLHLYPATWLNWTLWVAIYTAAVCQMACPLAWKILKLQGSKCYSKREPGSWRRMGKRESWILCKRKPEVVKVVSQLFSVSVLKCC